jgi:hypothetical protein
MKKCLSVCSVLALAVFATACTKSSPSRPTAVAAEETQGASVTDAKSGITLTTPTAVSPANNAQVRFAEQPVTLTIRNAATTGSTVLTYTFQVASDAGFGTVVFSRDNVAEGGSGQTSVAVDRLVGARTYYWRARANSGGVTGLFTAARSVAIGPEVVLQKPTLGDPATNSSVPEQPILNVYTVPRTGPAGAITYRFEVSESSGFGSLAYVATVNERGDLPYTPHQVQTKLTADKTYFWRVQARDASNNINSPFSDAQQFKVTRGIDLKTATIEIGPGDFGNWEETARITEAYYVPGSLCIFHTRLGIWPPTLFASDGTTIEGNQWVFANIGDKWYGGAADWYRPGQACKGIDEFSIGRDAFYLKPQSPIYSWIPQSGETLAVASSTPARAWPTFRTYDERTNVELIIWP